MTLIHIVIYARSTLCGLTSRGVLPVDLVRGEPISHAEEILSKEKLFQERGGE
jgi:hypothetical protein